MYLLRNIFITLASTMPLSLAQVPASQYFQTVLGYTPSSRSVEFKKVDALLNKGEREAAVDYIMNLSSFYETKILKFANQMLTPNDDVYASLSDMTATVLGVVKNDQDFRLILTGDFLYAPASKVAPLGHSLESNLPYRTLTRYKDYSRFLRQVSPQWRSDLAPRYAGILTTREWAKLYYSAGTNRRAVKGVFNAFLCTDIEEWRDKLIEDSWVRQDITRIPGGNAKEYQNRCKSCHAPMDAMAGVFAKIDFKNDRLKFTEEVLDKYLRNNDIFPFGYRTIDTAWENKLTKRHNTKFGWDGSAMQGTELKEYAKMISNSDGFARCMSMRAVESICGERPSYSHPYVNELSNFFKLNSYQLKSLLKKVVLDEKCNS